MCVLKTLNPNITAHHAGTHLLSVTVCLHSEVKHFGAAVTSRSQTGAGTLINENPSVCTYTSQIGNNSFLRGENIPIMTVGKRLHV